MTSHQEKWNARYQETTSPASPAQILLEYSHLLPPTGRALDLACGLGANALFLARQGLETHAWDISEVAIQRLHSYSETEGSVLQTEVRDVVRCPPPDNTFDVIIVCRFLERALVPALIKALRPSGLLFYQTFTRTTVHQEYGPKNPEYRLADHELLQLFNELQLIVYREEGRLGDTQRGFRNEALLIGKRKI